MINKNGLKEKNGGVDSAFQDLPEIIRIDESKEIIIGISATMKSLVIMAKRIAATHHPVLITGPTGSGKEIFANLIHYFSNFPNEPFIDVNCSAIPESLIESELFGHEKGSFTGATSDHKGYFTLAAKGSLFLDEIAELPMSQQAKLLRVIETKFFRPVGSERRIEFKGRIITATHANLEQAVKGKTFREDLFHRLNVFRLEVPGLDKRREDIPALIQCFSQNQKQPFGFKRAAIDKMAKANWPGNIRQLKNTIDRIAVLCDESPVSADAAKKYISEENKEPYKILDLVTKNVLNLDFKNKLSAVEFNLINQALTDSGGNKSEAARKLGVHRKFIERRLKVFDSDLSQVYELSIKGERLMANSDYKSAVKDFQKAIQILDKYSFSHKLEEIKLEILLRLCVCQRNIHGWNHSEVNRTYDEARRTGRSLNKIDALSTVSFGHWVDHLVKLDLRKALDIALDFLAEGQNSKSPYICSQAYLALANTYLWLAKYDKSLENLDQFIGLYDNNNEFLLDYGYDPYILYLMLLSLTSYQVGDFKKCQSALDHLLQHAQKIDHPFSKAIALQAGTWVEFLLDNEQASFEHARNLVQLSKENSFPFYLGLGMIFEGFQIAIKQDMVEGIKKVEKGFKAMHKEQGFLFHSMYILVLGAIYYEKSELLNGINILNRGINFCKINHELCYLGNLINLRGKLHMKANNHEQAESDFLQVMNIAKEHGSLSQTLQAGLNLSHLQNLQGQKFNALETLSIVIAEFPVETDYPLYLKAVESFKRMSSDNNN